MEAEAEEEVVEAEWLVVMVVEMLAEEEMLVARPEVRVGQRKVGNVFQTEDA